jgi:hypothetical protein
MSDQDSELRSFSPDMPKVFVKSLQSDAQHSENGDTDAMAHETG